jgi:hypothetical protein
LGQLDRLLAHRDTRKSSHPRSEVVSPKADAPLVLHEADELKLVYPQLAALPDRFAQFPARHHWLSPMDGPQLRRNTEAAAAYCLTHPRCRLAIQAHELGPSVIEQAVTFSIEAAHLTEGDPRLHGHSYVIEVWTAKSARLLHAGSRSAGGSLPHRLYDAEREHRRNDDRAFDGMAVAAIRFPSCDAGGRPPSLELIMVHRSNAAIGTRAARRSRWPYRLLPSERSILAMCS